MQDVPGVLYGPADAYFDPNGWMTGANGIKNAINSATGYDQKWVYVQIGQGDYTMGSTKAEYAQGLINAITYYLNNTNANVMLGFTNFGNPQSNPGLLDAWMTNQSTLIDAGSANPANDGGNGVGGWWAALQYFAGNPRVFRGPCLRYELNPPRLPTSWVTGTPGLVADVNAGTGLAAYVHMNDPALAQFSALVDHYFQLAGV